LVMRLGKPIRRQKLGKGRNDVWRKPKARAKKKGHYKGKVLPARNGEEKNGRATGQKGERSFFKLRLC